MLDVKFEIKFYHSFILKHAIYMPKDQKFFV